MAFQTGSPDDSSTRARGQAGTSTTKESETMTGGSAPKRKGSQFERDVVRYLQEHGFPDAERAYGAGRPEDVGDIAGVPGICCEVKNHARLELAQWVDEAESERINARQPFAVVIAKRRGKGTAQSYVVMTLESFTRLVTS